jgi:hypothetical protein
MVIFTKANINRENFMAMENTYGKLVQCMMVNLPTDQEMELANGNQIKPNSISLLANIKMIKNQEKESIFGIMVLYTMVVLTMT